MAELAAAKRETMTRKCLCGETFIGRKDDEMCAVCYFKKESAPERRTNRAVKTRAEERANLRDLAAKHSNIVRLHGYGCAKSRAAWAEFDAAVDRLLGDA